jgi:predicted ATPase
MVYLKKFAFLDEKKEIIIIRDEKRTCFNNYYPLHLFPMRELKNISFKDVTFFYGGNGSGKSTVLNIIAQKLNAERAQKADKGEYFDKYVNECSFEMPKRPDAVKIVTSDDVFDYLLDIRNINNRVEKTRDELFEEYMRHKYGSGNNAHDYEKLKKTNAARKQTMSAYVRERLGKNIIEQSNGESALLYFEKEIRENSLYLLDEPENSLSAQSQTKLLKFIEDSARYYNCQFIISTHSPFLLSMSGAAIYDLDSIPVCLKKWTELENMKTYHDFFKLHENEF